MKRSKLNEIQGVLVSEGRSDLAQTIAGIVPGVPDGTGPQGMGRSKGRKGQMGEPCPVEGDDYDDYLKSTLKGMGKSLKDIKSLNKEEWQKIDDGYKAKNETD